MLRLNQDKPEVEEVWRSKRRVGISATNATPFFLDGVLYGNDMGKGNLIAAGGKDGVRLWATFDATDPKETRRLPIDRLRKCVGPIDRGALDQTTAVVRWSTLSSSVCPCSCDETAWDC